MLSLTKSTIKVRRFASAFSRLRSHTIDVSRRKKISWSGLNARRLSWNMNSKVLSPPAPQRSQV